MGPGNDLKICTQVIIPKQHQMIHINLPKKCLKSCHVKKPQWSPFKFPFLSNSLLINQASDIPSTLTKSTFTLPSLICISLYYSSVQSYLKASQSINRTYNSYSVCLVFKLNTDSSSLLSCLKSSDPDHDISGMPLNKSKSFERYCQRAYPYT
jgi:hypothetical protein